MKDIETVITKFKENNDKEITFVTIHGIETTISKNDEIKVENNLLYILKENGETEIIAFTDHIFKIIIK